MCRRIRARSSQTNATIQLGSTSPLSQSYTRRICTWPNVWRVRINTGCHGQQFTGGERAPLKRPNQNFPDFLATLHAGYSSVGRVVALDYWIPHGSTPAGSWRRLRPGGFLRSSRFGIAIHSTLPQPYFISRQSRCCADLLGADEIVLRHAALSTTYVPL